MKRFLFVLGTSVLAGLSGCDLLKMVDNDIPDIDEDPKTTTAIHGTIQHDTVWSAATNQIDGGLTISANVVWKKGIRVTVDNDAHISINNNGKLTIEEGVVISFGTDAYIQTGYSTSGTLIAKGSDSLPIIFTKNTGIQNWGYHSGGILLYDKTTNLTVFDHCIIEHATTGINVISPTLPAVITNCIIRNNAQYGIDFGNKGMPKDSASFVNDTIINNGSYPISIIAEGLTKLSGDTYFKGNGKDAIEVTGGNVTLSGTWKKHNIPYVFTDNAGLGAATGVTITIAPGVICKFDAGAYIDVGYSHPATLIANGTALDSIKFTNTIAGAPWGYTGTHGGGLMFWDNTSTNTSLKYCVIDSATNGMYVGKTKIVISNCSIFGHTGSGIYFSANGTPKDSASFVDNYITGNGEYGIEIYASNLGNLSGTGSVAGNTKGGIFVTGDKVDVSGVWKKHDAPYIVDGDVRIESATGTTVTVRPGARFEFVQDAHINVGYSETGALIADGTPGVGQDSLLTQIVFTGHIDGAYWGYSGNDGAGIMLWDKTAGTTLLKYCLISKATAGVYINTKSNVTVQNCNVGANETYGIGYFNQSTPVSNVLNNNAVAGVNPSGDFINLNP